MPLFETLFVCTVNFFKLVLQYRTLLDDAPRCLNKFYNIAGI